MSRHSRELAELYLEVDRMLDRIKPFLTRRDYRDLSGVIEWWKLLTPLDEPDQGSASEPEEPPADLNA